MSSLYHLVNICKGQSQTENFGRSNLKILFLYSKALPQPFSENFITFHQIINEGNRNTTVYSRDVTISEN